MYSAPPAADHPRTPAGLGKSGACGGVGTSVACGGGEWRGPIPQASVSRKDSAERDVCVRMEESNRHSSHIDIFVPAGSRSRVEALGIGGKTGLLVAGIHNTRRPGDEWAVCGCGGDAVPGVYLLLAVVRPASAGGSTEGISLEEITGLFAGHTQHKNQTVDDVGVAEPRARARSELSEGRKCKYTCADTGSGGGGGGGGGLTA